VAFSLTSRDGDEGYPGTVQVQGGDRALCATRAGSPHNPPQATVEYRLTDANELVMTFSASTDKTTLVNLCNHTYWNLSGDFEATVAEQSLELAASSIVGVDDTLVPVDGSLVPVEGTPFDFRTPERIGKRIFDIGNSPPGCVRAGGPHASVGRCAGG
jgi:aldose 1-epimerase